MKYSFLSLSFLLVSLLGLAQGNSPLSQFGPGDFYGSNFQSNFSRAGIGASSTSGNMINTINPASYSDLTLTTGETGIFSSLNFVNANEGNSLFTNTNLTSFGLGFPVREHLGMAFGLKPYSKQNYSFSYNETLSDNSEVEYEYSGEGGLSEVFFGIGGSQKGFSAGINGQYYFGRLNDISKVIYSASDYKNIRFQEFNNVHGFSLTAGAQYLRNFNNQNYFKFGASYDVGNTLSTTKTQNNQARMLTIDY